MKRDFHPDEQHPAGLPPPGVTARLVEYARGRFVALAPHTTLEVIEHPRAVAVPGSAYYGHGLMAWQEKRIPLIDLHTLVEAHRRNAELPLPRYALVVAFQAGPGQAVRHGAIGMAQLPQSVMASDACACTLPMDSDIWPQVAIACFRHEGKPVPVLDTGRLFAAFHG